MDLIRNYNYTLSLDLIFGIPHQSEFDLMSDLKEATDLAPEHISLYTLMYSKGTLITRLTEEGSLVIPEEDDVSDMFIKSGEYLMSKGYERYEVSNFAKEGFRCSHNLNYWHLGEYVAYGAGASGYFDGQRYTNISDYKKYIRALEDACLPREFSEKLGIEDRWLEYVMLSLRLKEGLNSDILKELSLTEELKVNYLNLINKFTPFVNEGYIIKRDKNFFYSEKGVVILDEITQSLL